MQRKLTVLFAGTCPYALLTLVIIAAKSPYSAFRSLPSNLDQGSNHLCSVVLLRAKDIFTLILYLSFYLNPLWVFTIYTTNKAIIS